MTPNGKSPKAPPHFDMPPVQLGDTVFWLPGGDVAERPHAAFVTAVDSDSVALAITGPLIERFMVRDGVRHVDDPRARSDDVQQNGGWCHRDDYLTRPDVPERMKQAAGLRVTRKPAPQPQPAAAAK